MTTEGASASAAACAVARLEPDGPWVGFAPTLDDGYALVVGDSAATARRPATPDELVALAAVYFQDGLPEPPEELAATLGDIGALIRHVAEVRAAPAEDRAFQEAVDAIDDGLSADAVLECLSRILGSFGAERDPERLLRTRVSELRTAGETGSERLT